METLFGNVAALAVLLALVGIAISEIRRERARRRDAQIVAFWRDYQTLQADVANLLRPCGACGHPHVKHAEDGRGSCKAGGRGADGPPCPCRYATPDPELARRGLALVVEARALGINIRTPSPPAAPASAHRRPS